MSRRKLSISVMFLSSVAFSISIFPPSTKSRTPRFLINVVSNVPNAED